MPPQSFALGVAVLASTLPVSRITYWNDSRSDPAEIAATEPPVHLRPVISKVRCFMESVGQDQIYPYPRPPCT